MIKLIASDMDGTLLNSNKQLSKSVYDILKKLNDKGIIFVAISGRDIFSLKKIFKAFNELIVASSIVSLVFIVAYFTVPKEETVLKKFVLVQRNAPLPKPMKELIKEGFDFEGYYKQ